MTRELLESQGFWLTVGFGGQAFFTARFLVQWAVSESRRESVVPVAFWWLSLGGGAALLAYAAHRRDPVIVVGQAMGLFVYARNLMLTAKARERDARRRKRTEALVTAAAEDARRPVVVRVDAPER